MISMFRSRIIIATVRGMSRAYSSGISESKSFYALFPQTFPRGGPPNSPFVIDARALRKEFLQQQAKVHPDKAGSVNANRDNLEALSSELNIAYKVLLNPLQRAEHILQQQGIDALAERESLVDEDLLMDVLVTREAISEVSTSEEFEELLKENNSKIELAEDILERAFKDGDLETAKLETIKLSYWMNIKGHLSEAAEMLG